MTTEKPQPNWICCQIGSREHYAIPRALHRSGQLTMLLTDYWSRTPSFINVQHPFVRKILERNHSDLLDAQVVHLGPGRLVFDLQAKVKKWSPWEMTMRRNEWFQRKMLARLNARKEFLEKQPPGIFFAYSYAAVHLLKFFRDLGWITVLGQIDPGIREEEIVADEVEKHPEIETTWEKAPDRYWGIWRHECRLADTILVNSEWSRRALIDKSIPENKIRVVPLAYEKPTRDLKRPYPSAYSADRPLRVLFLGQINVRKGTRLVLEAARLLEGQPIEFRMVGPCDIEIPPEFRHHPDFKWTGPVSRSQAGDYYASSDVFLLPTFSDGFAITQLEAQAEKLPVIASRFCGDVVEDERNGLIVDPLDARTLADALKRFIENPELAPRLSEDCGLDRKFTLDGLSDHLDEIPLRSSDTEPVSQPARRKSNARPAARANPRSPTIRT